MPAVPAARRAGHAVVRRLGVRPLRPVAPGVTRHRVQPQGLELLHELLAARRREARADADVVEPSRVVVEPEQEGAHHRPRAVLVPAEACHGAVGGARVLHLHHRAHARLVGAIEPLRHDAVEAGSLESREPVGGDRAVAGRGGEEHPRAVAAGEGALEENAALGERRTAQVPVFQGEEVEHHHARRALHRELLHPRGGGVDAKEEPLEVEPLLAGDDDLAVHHAAYGEAREQWALELREVAIERLQLAGLEVEPRPVAEHDGAEAIPLRLEQPAIARGERVAGLGEHRLDRWRDGIGHSQLLTGDAAAIWELGARLDAPSLPGGPPRDQAPHERHFIQLPGPRLR